MALNHNRASGKFSFSFMQKQDQSIEWVDFIAIPAAAALSFVLRIWLTGPLATTLSVIVVLFVLFLLERRRMTFKKAILVILLIGLSVYPLSALFHWYY
jgi:hypothetical protein